MAIGTLGAYFGIILANNNQAADTARQQKQLEELQRQYACNEVPYDKSVTFTKPEPQLFDKASVTAVRTEDVKVGTGEELKSAEQCVAVHYLGNLSDGKVFDNSYDRNQPLEIFMNQVIPGWSEGMIGMKVGGIRKMYIPADKAYGDKGTGGDIGPNEPLYFYVELLGIRK
jgi:FKBP-type peptidyl-prolyl cis-trans isomerase